MPTSVAEPMCEFARKHGKQCRAQAHEQTGANSGGALVIVAFDANGGTQHCGETQPKEDFV
jgi:hypothetical protein